MANSGYEYTRQFERPNHILPNTWIVVRIDGHAFHKLSAKYEWEKPNDIKALQLMNKAAHAAMGEIPDIALAYGQSDEYSFVFHPACQLYDRREDKLISTVVSVFTAHYIYLWPSQFADKALSAPLPSFDGRAVVYPTLENLKDYLSWRQVDCHINNLYNTTFWTIVNRGGLSRSSAEKQLSGTVAHDKNELLFSNFGINYNSEPAIFRKGSIQYHDYYIAHNRQNSEGFSPTSPSEDPSSSQGPSKPRPAGPKPKSRISIANVDIIGNEFWERYPWLLKHGSERKKVVLESFKRTSEGG